MRLGNQLVAVGVLAFALACRERSKPEPVADLRAVEPVEKVAPAGRDAGLPNTASARCQKSGSTRFRLLATSSAQQTAQQAAQEPGAKRASEISPDDLGAELPFSVELGGVLHRGEDYVVGYLAGGQAKLAVLSANLEQQSLIELGRVRGDVPPPKVAQDGTDVVIVVPDRDPSGGVLRLARWSPNGGLVWGAVVPEGDDESKAFSLEARQGTVLLVWDDWEPDRPSGSGAAGTPGAPGTLPGRFPGALATKGENVRRGHSVVRATHFAGKNLQETAAIETLSTSLVDTESPRLVERPGGYWLGWLVSTPITHGVAASAPEPTSASASASASASGAAEEIRSGTGPQAIEVVALDYQGNKQGAPLRVSDALNDLAGFDLMAARAGGALVVFRDHVPLGGADGGELRLARVASGGAVEDRILADSELGAGAPSFIVDLAAGPKQESKPWIAVLGRDESQRIAPLVEVGSKAELGRSLEPEPELERATPLVRVGNRLLVATPRGRDMELFFATCPF